MNKKRFTEEQIALVLHQMESAAKLAEAFASLARNSGYSVGRARTASG